MNLQTIYERTYRDLDTLQMDVILQTPDAIYLRLPREMWIPKRLIACGCDAVGEPTPLHRAELCAGSSWWDTLVVPIQRKGEENDDFTHSLSMPDCMIEFWCYLYTAKRRPDFSLWIKRIGKEFKLREDLIAEMREPLDRNLEGGA